MTSATLNQTVFLFDADCGACEKVMGTIKARVQPPVDITPFQGFDYKAFGITTNDLAKGPIFISLDNNFKIGPLGMAEMLKLAKNPWRGVGHFMLLPGVRSVLKKIGPFMYSKRIYLPGATAACSIPKN